MLAWLSDLLDLALGVWIPLAGAGACFVAAVFSWLRMPWPSLGRQVAIAFIVIGFVLVAYAAGYLVARGDCQDKTLREKVDRLEDANAELARQMAVSAAIGRGAAEVAEAAQRKATEEKGRADDLEKELRNRPAPRACDWTDDERRRLRGITIGRPAAGRGRSDPGAR